MQVITKKIIIVVLLTALVLGLAACGNATAKDSSEVAEGNASGEQSAEQPIGGSVMIPNPFIDCGTLEEAEKAAGFTITIPAVQEATNVVYRAMSGQMIEVIYLKGEDEILRVRKAPGTDPVDGDYNEYEKNGNIEYYDAGDLPVIHVRMNGDLIHVATWTAAENGKDYSYAVTSDAGIEESDARTIFDEMLGIVPVQIETGDGRKYSPRTVIITTDGKFSEEELAALLKKYSLEVKYDYEGLDIYALSADHDMNEKELNALLEDLRSEEKILGAEADEMITLTDPVRPATAVY